MKDFAELLDRLAFTPGRTAKLKLMHDYFRRTPDPDRGYALAILTDGLPISLPVRRTLADLMTKHLDPELYRLSRDYVGDTAETVALAWPDARTASPPLRLAEIVRRLELIDRQQLAAQLESWLDSLDSTGRWALLKLLTGALRVGVSARLAKTAVAGMSDKTVDDIEELWHGLKPPYAALFEWFDGRGPRPDISGAPVFRPVMLAHPLEDSDLERLEIADFSVEWKWDGIRVQIAAAGGDTRLYSRTGEDIGKSFPELMQMFRFDAVLDGEVLVLRDGEVAPFNDLQQRLNRKAVTKVLLQKHPAHVRLYDALMIDDEDLRALPFVERRARLLAWHRSKRPANTDVSEVLDVPSKAALEKIWRETRRAGIEGLMLKRRSSPYLAGRPRGHWFKWKRAPLTADCVLMYAQRGSGKRSSYYSDYTFGIWREREGAGRELVPVGKAYSGFTDAELHDLDRWIRANTTERFGPVRAVAPGLVLEIAFDSVQKSARHKSGIALRFPRVHRIRWDKPVAEAGTLSEMAKLLRE